MLLSIQFTDKDDHFLHTLHFQHHILYLAQFDTQAPQFNLVVGTSKDNNITIWQPLGIVTRLVNAFAMIFHEALTRHLVEVVVSFGNTSTANVQLTNDSCRQFVAICIHDKFLHIQLWPANSNQFRIGKFRIV